MTAKTAGRPGILVKMVLVASTNRKPKASELPFSKKSVIRIVFRAGAKSEELGVGSMKALLYAVFLLLSLPNLIAGVASLIIRHTFATRNPLLIVVDFFFQVAWGLPWPRRC